MMAAKSNYFNEASETMYKMSADERIRKICRDREEYHQDIRNYQRAIAQRDDTIAEMGDTIIQQKKALAEKDDTISEKEHIIKQLTSELECFKKQ